MGKAAAHGRHRFAALAWATALLLLTACADTPAEMPLTTDFPAAFGAAYDAGKASEMRLLAERHRDRTRPEVEALLRQVLVETDRARAAALLGRARALASLCRSVSDDPVPADQVARAAAWSDAERQRKLDADRATAAGLRAFNEGRFADAVESAATASNLARDLGDTPGEIAALNLAGRAQRSLGRYDLAITDHQQALALARQSRDRAGQAASTRGLGDVLERQKDHARAIEAYQDALAVLRLPEDWRQADTTLQQLGDIHVVAGQFDRAIDAYSLALRYGEQAGDPVAVARSRDYLGYANRRLGAYPEAARWHRDALAGTELILAADEQHRARARAFNHLGLVLQGSGQTASAAGDADAAERLLGQAIDNEQHALDEATAVADRIRQGYILRALANIHLDAAMLDPSQVDRAHLERAREIAERAAALGREMAHPEWEGLAFHQLAQAQARLRRGTDARATLDRALRIWTAIGDSYSAGYLHLIAARELYERAGEVDRALEEYELARAAFDKVNAVHDIVEVAQRHGMMLQRLGRLSEADTLYARALAITEAAFGADHPQVAQALNYLVDIHLVEGRYREGLDLARRATAINRIRLERSAAGRADAHAGPDAGFRDHIALAYGVADRDPTARNPLLAEAFDVAQLAHGADVGRALARMSARFSSGSNDLARVVRQREETLERRRRLERQLLDAFASPPASRSPAHEATLRSEITQREAELAALDERLAREFPSYAELADPRPLPLAQTQALLDADEALLVYAVADDATFLWALRRDRASVYRIAIGRTALTAEITALRSTLDPAQNPRLAPFDVVRGHALHQLLIAPASEALNGARHVLVVPDGALQSLPFGVLVTERPKSRLGTLEQHRKVPWLARKFALTVLPSVSSLRALRTTIRTERAASPFIGIGDPTLEGPPAGTRGRARLARLFRGGKVDVDAVRSLQPLPDTRQELEALARATGAERGSLFLAERASEPLLRAAELDRYRVVAFATHGLVAGEISGLAEPALVLTPPEAATPENDGLLTASKVAQLTLNADWVLLSACNTAASDGKPGAEGLSGLAKAFFYAGSRAILVSHWPLVSSAAVQLTTRAFDELARAPEIGRAEALRRSMLALLDDKTQPAYFVHPLVWAPFVVVGEGGRGR